jgi:hypothetical protein
MNCLKPGHFIKQCKSLHHCKLCQKPHHTLLHIENPPTSTTPSPGLTTTPNPNPKTPHVSANVIASLAPNSLLMTCRIMVEVNARVLLDSASSASFVSERLVKSLCLPRLHQTTTICGVAGLTRNSLQSLTNLSISSPRTNFKFNITAIVVPRVTCDLLVHPVSFGPTWTHLNDIPLADPHSGTPGRIDILLGVDVFTSSLLHGRRIGPPGTPAAFETVFGWVLAGPTTEPTPGSFITSHHTLIATGDDLLRQFWEIEESTKHETNLSPEEGLLCSTLTNPIIVQLMEDSLCHYPRNLTLRHWVSQDRMPFGDSYRLNDLCTPRVNSRPLMQ